MGLRAAPLDLLDRRDLHVVLEQLDNQKQVDKVPLAVVQLVPRLQFNPKQLLSNQLYHQIVKYQLVLGHVLI